MSLENSSCRYRWEIHSIIPSFTSCWTFLWSNLLANELGSRMQSHRSSSYIPPYLISFFPSLCGSSLILCLRSIFGKHGRLKNLYHIFQVDFMKVKPSCPSERKEKDFYFIIICSLLYASWKLCRNLFQSGLSYRPLLLHPDLSSNQSEFSFYQRGT